jgi:tetratricopeptide (TPR) repeat protein
MTNPLIRFVFAAVFSASAFSAFAQEQKPQSGANSPSLVDQSLVFPRIVAARVEFNKGNVRGALTIFREVLQTDPNNSSALFGVSECHYNLKRYKLALEYLDKAVAVDPKVSSQTNLYYGQIHHRTGNLDEAIEYYKRYQQSQRNSYDIKMAQKYIEQCEYAKEMMKKPVDVTITNLGEEINSRYDDYTPSISADGKRLIFTARRIDTKGGRMDTEGDYRYFEDIYSAKWNEEEQRWDRAFAVEGDLNTETHDAVLSIFPDGTGMYVYKNTVTTTGDIYYSNYDKSNDTWSAAVKMPRPINTSYFESSISITADGQTLYFVSERPEGKGQGDIYVANKVGSGWSTPKNLGPIINTEFDEKFVFIHPNGRTLFFASDGHLTMGSYDIFKSELINGSWSKPVNLGYPINTVNEESTFSLTNDNKTMIIAAEYDDSFGERDIYAIDISRYAMISEGYDQINYGQLEVNFLNNKGKGLKGAYVEAYSVSTGESVGKGQTDKNGQLKLTLKGNQEYRLVLRDGTFESTKSVALTLKENEETIVPVEFILTK